MNQPILPSGQSEAFNLEESKNVQSNRIKNSPSSSNYNCNCDGCFIFCNDLICCNLCCQDLDCDQCCNNMIATATVIAIQMSLF